MWHTVHCGKYCTQHTLHNTQCIQGGRELFFLLWDDDKGNSALHSLLRRPLLFCTCSDSAVLASSAEEFVVFSSLLLLLLVQQIDSVGLLSSNSEKTKYHTIYSRHLYNVRELFAVIVGKTSAQMQFRPKFITLFSPSFPYRLKPWHVNSIKQKYIDLFTDNRKVKPLKAKDHRPKLTTYL